MMIHELAEHELADHEPHLHLQQKLLLMAADG